VNLKDGGYKHLYNTVGVEQIEEVQTAGRGNPIFTREIDEVIPPRYPKHGSSCRMI